MSQQDTPNPTLEAIRLLRKSGHHEAAAELAEDALQQATAPPAEEHKEPTRDTNGALAADDARRGEGQAMLDQLRRQGIGPLQPEPSEEDAA